MLVIGYAIRRGAAALKFEQLRSTAEEDPPTVPREVIRLGNFQNGKSRFQKVIGPERPIHRRNGNGGLATPAEAIKGAG